MRNAAILSIVALALANCTNGDDSKASGGVTSEGTVSEKPMASPAADGAETFVRAQYSATIGGTRPGDFTTIAWSARTAALIAQANAMQVEGDAGVFEADPVCDCSDGPGVTLRSVTVTPTGEDTADAVVVTDWTMSQPPEVDRRTLRLVREGGAWKLDDIQRDQTETAKWEPLVQNLSSFIAERRAGQAQ